MAKEYDHLFKLLIIGDSGKLATINMKIDSLGPYKNFLLSFLIYTGYNGSASWLAAKMNFSFCIHVKFENLKRGRSPSLTVEKEGDCARIIFRDIFCELWHFLKFLQKYNIVIHFNGLVNY